MKPQTPLYKTRKFWIVTISIEFLVCLMLLVVIGFPSNSFIELLYLLTFSLGGGLFTVLIATFFNNPTNIELLTMAVYLPILAIFTIKIVRDGAIKIFIPLLFSLCILISLASALLLASSFS